MTPHASWCWANELDPLTLRHKPCICWLRRVFASSVAAELWAFRTYRDALVEREKLLQ